LIYAFADLDETTLTVRPNNPAIDIDQEFYRKFNDLKSQNPKLQTMLAVGGWVDSNINDKYLQMVSTSENIQVFVDSVLHILNEYGFDGLDMDWEYPRSEADKIGFTNLLAALKNAFAPFNYILSAAVRPVPAIPEDLGIIKIIITC
jgi:chitinase